MEDRFTPDAQNVQGGEEGLTERQAGENSAYRNTDSVGATAGPPYGQPPKVKKKKRGNGGYIALAIACLFIGIAIGSVLTAVIAFTGRGILDNTQDKSSIEDFFGDYYGHSEEPAQTPQPSQYEEPAETPREYVSRTLPDFDGVLPVISDTVNPIPDIVEQVMDGVVGVTCYASQEDYDSKLYSSYGSGFIISSEGYIVTNAHVIEGMKYVTINLTSGEEVDAQIVGSDTKLDVAVLKIDANGLKPLAIGISTDVRVGEYTIAIGNPTGDELAGTTTFGIISATARTTNIDGVSNVYLQTDAAINPGSSGGPLLNLKGEVIGITTAKTLYAGYDEYGNAINAEGLGFAIPLDEAMKVVAQLITEGHVVRPGIGISVYEVDATTAQKYDVPVGVLVYTVTKNGPAHKADLRINDIIVECDGQPVENQEDFIKYVQAKGVGDVLTFKVWRDGEYLDIPLTVGDLNEMGARYWIMPVRICLTDFE